VYTIYTYCILKSRYPNLSKSSEEVRRDKKTIAATLETCNRYTYQLVENDETHGKRTIINTTKLYALPSRIWTRFIIKVFILLIIMIYFVLVSLYENQHSVVIYSVI